MLFSSAIFIFIFLPIVLLVYYASPDRMRNAIILVSSLIFYMWGETYMVAVMITTIVIDFSAALIIENGKRKFGLMLSIISNLCLLGFFKYFNFAADNLISVLTFLGVDNGSIPGIPKIMLPLGISFYTFQSLSYTIDVYRGEVKANRNILNFAAFVTIFPQLIAGPIVRYIDVENQIRNKNISLDNFAEGIKRFIVGLSKKMLLANSFASLADHVFESPISELSTGWAWIGIVAYSIQIFYDFSGYSDMAIGLGKMLGFDFLENFNYPYISKSIREFWQRWHISLSTWFRDYLYIPLGGSKTTRLKTYRNLLIVFFVTGLWHGASWNFVIWGLFHGFFLILERVGLNNLLQRLWLPFRHLYALLVVIIGWVFFRVESLNECFSFLSVMFSIHEGDASRVSYLSFFFENTEYLFLSFLAVLCATPLPMTVFQKLISFGKFNNAMRLAEVTFLFLLFVISLSYIAADTYNPFIYFRF